MSYHASRNVEDAIIRLLDALCSWERDTGRGSTLILIPHTRADGDIVVAQDGKPIKSDIHFLEERVFKEALSRRAKA